MDEEPRIPCIDQWIENILNNTNEKLKQVESGLEKNEEFEDKYDNLLHQILNLKLQINKIDKFLNKMNKC